MDEYTSKNIELCRRIQSGDNSACEELLVLNDGLIRTQVNKIKEKHMLSHMYEYNDAYQDCALALLNAAKDYDAQKGTFSTYAVWRMFGDVSRSWDSARPAHIPNDTIKSFRMGRLSEEMENYIDSVLHPVSLDEPLYEEESSGFMDEIYPEDMIANTIPVTPESYAEYEDAKSILFHFISLLPLREQRVIIRYFGLDGEECETLDEISTRETCGGKAICQLKAKALRGLRFKMRGYGPQTFDILKVKDEGPFAQAYKETLSRSCESCGYYDKEEQICSKKKSGRVITRPDTEYCNAWSVTVEEEEESATQSAALTAENTI